MITDRMMQGLIYRAFVTRELESTEIDLEGWRWPWREVVLAAESRALGYDAHTRLYEACRMVAAGDEEAQRQWMREIEAAKEPLHFPTLAELAETLPPVRWLWPGWIPRGMISLLGAYQGTGKSYFVMDLARTVIHGGPWPDGTPAAKMGPVIYVDAEAIPQVNNERAVKLGLNRHQLYLMMPSHGEILDLTNVRWQNQLVDMVYAVRPELIIVDSYSSISSGGQNSVEDTQRLLAFLVGLGNFADCGLLVLHHLRKPPGGQLSLPGMSVHDFRGSGNITAMARSVMGLSVIQNGRQFSLNGPRRLDLVKTNLGPYPDALGIEMVTQGDLVRFAYGKAPSFEGTPEEVAPEEWLVGYLEENGPTRFGDLVTDAEREGIGKSALHRARKKLGDRIVDSGKRQARGNQWLLAEQVGELEGAPAGEDEAGAVVDDVV